MNPEHPNDTEQCTCDLCQMGVEAEQVDKELFVASCMDAPGLEGWGMFEEEAVEELLDFIFAIPFN